MKKIIFSFFAFAYCSMLVSAEFRMDIGGVKGASLRPVSASSGVSVVQASWLGKNKDFRLSCTASLTDEWKEFSFSFLPKKDGYYAINLMSSNSKDKVCCDHIIVSGAELKNASFEELDAGGNPVNWRKMGKASVSENDPADGCRCAVSSHDDRWMQHIKCQKGKAVTIKFKARKL